MGQPYERFVPKIEWRWDAIPPSVYELIQRTLETGNVKYLEPLGLPDTAFKEKDRGCDDNKDSSKCEEMFILNKYLDQVEVACKFATRCQLYERKLAELEKTLEEEKKASCALRQKYQILQSNMTDLTTMEKFSRYVQQADSRCREGASLKCFMAEFYRSHVMRVSIFLDAEVRKMNRVLQGADRDTTLSQVVNTARLICSEFSKCAATLTTIFRDGNGEMYMFPLPLVTTNQPHYQNDMKEGPCGSEEDLEQLVGRFEAMTCEPEVVDMRATVPLFEETQPSSPEPSQSPSPQSRKKNRRKNKSKNKH